jgi:hypothetical protein
MGWVISSSIWWYFLDSTLALRKSNLIQVTEAETSRPFGAVTSHDVLSGFLPPISPHFGHLIMFGARRTSSFGWILYPHCGQGCEKSKLGFPLNRGVI